MSLKVSLRHRTEYFYDRRIELGPQIVRLRPAPHSRTPIPSYALKIEAGEHFLNWQQDPYGNYLARLVFQERAEKLAIDVSLTADMTVINPFDFFLEDSAENYPFDYNEAVLADLRPFLGDIENGSQLLTFMAGIDTTPKRLIDFLVEVNRYVYDAIEYLIRMEPGVQSCEETLTKRSGSCRDSAWLLVNIFRHLGLAARFASGYLIQLTPDVKPVDGPEGPTSDFVDLHAWTEVYLPGAGWVGLDPTSGLLAGEGHIPLACTPQPSSAAPITGSHEECEVKFGFSMELERIEERPRVTKPYSEETWQSILSAGRAVDEKLNASDVRLTMGGEPTFVSVSNSEEPEWQTEALGAEKLRAGDQITIRLRERFAAGGLIQHAQGKWYPGEMLPRWGNRVYWRTDGEPIWNDVSLIADRTEHLGHGYTEAYAFINRLAERLEVNRDHIQSAYEDILYYMWKERRLPVDVNVANNGLEDELERKRIARIFEQGVTSPVGCVLPLQYHWWDTSPTWRSQPWVVRADELFLIPGDSAMGFRLPLESLQKVDTKQMTAASLYSQMQPLDPLETRVALPRRHSLHRVAATSASLTSVATTSVPEADGASDVASYLNRTANQNGNGDPIHPPTTGDAPHGNQDASQALAAYVANTEVPTRTALCVEPRDGRLHVFMPPTDRIEAFLILVEAIEDTAKDLGIPVTIEGYPAPHDPRIREFSVTPDPGVLEVNIHPGYDWNELVDITTGVYEEARQVGLATDRFDLDGTHSGTGGGNHIVVGGKTPSDSPFLRRPDLLKSLIGYWHNHPSLSYLFAGRFIGPTSQAPRVDEGRQDASYELGIALEQIENDMSMAANYPFWHSDRVFRDLLVDVSGNRHRAEFSIDKMYTPEGSTGRLGLLELRAFEMPPHARMSLAQQLLMRTLIARFWNEPYDTPPVHWGTMLHDRFMLPHFLWQDFGDVIAESQTAGFGLELDWFQPHFEFSFPMIGQFDMKAVHVELRVASEPWYVLGETAAAGYMARYVDSSLERLEAKVTGLTDERFVLLCNGRRVPLHPTGVDGEAVAGVRYRAWQPPSCMHPTIPVDVPLVFDLIDTWSNRSLAGCRYDVGHPGGVNPETLPINASEAESRRAARFTRLAGTPGNVVVPDIEINPRFPFLLDLRRHRHR